MKGRNPNFIQLRNQHLVKRYYFWYEIERKRRDDVISILSEKEVFLDPEYIKTLLAQHSHLIKEIKQAKPKPAKLDEFQFTNMPIQSAKQSELFASA